MVAQLREIFKSIGLIGGILSFLHSPIWANTDADFSCEQATTGETLKIKQMENFVEIKSGIEEKFLKDRSKDNPLRGISLKALNVLYGSNAVVKKTMDTAMEGAKINRSKTRKSVGEKDPGRALGRCYMYTQIAAKQGGLTKDDRWVDETGISAKNAGPALKRRGFLNLMEIPEYKNQLVRNGKIRDLPLGAILVYDSYEGTSYGHIEIKTPRGYVSDYFSAGLRTRTAEDKKNGLEGSVKARGRTLIGVYIKPSLIEDKL